MHNRRSILKFAAAGIAGLALPARAFAAQSFPTKPIRIIIGLAPGGSTDTNTRLLAQSLSESIGQAVIVENRPGGGSTIGAAAVAASPADGYTLFMATGSYSTSVVLNKALSFKPETAFRAVTQFCRFPQAIAVSVQSGIQSLEQLIAKAKAAPGTIPFASTGYGGQTHFSGALFQIITGAALIHVPYKGGGPAVVDLVGGRVPVTFLDLPSLLPHVKTGGVRVLAVLGSRRSAIAPEIPTTLELGIKGLEIEGWYGLFAPAATPANVVRVINQQVAAICQRPEFVKRIAENGAEVVASSSDQFAEFYRRDVALYTSVAAKANIRLD